MRILPFGGLGSRELASNELFSVALAKLIFNFLSLIRRYGSSYGSLGLYANAVVVLLPPWPGLHGAPLFRGCIILPLETRHFLPYSRLLLFRLPFSRGLTRCHPLISALDPLIAPTTHVRPSATRSLPTVGRADMAN